MTPSRNSHETNFRKLTQMPKQGLFCTLLIFVFSCCMEFNGVQK